jgi:hypothetical protein
MCFVQFGDGKSQLASTPVFKAVNLAVPALNQVPVAFQHGRNLFALIRVDQKTDFEMSHCCSLWICQHECHAIKAFPEALTGTHTKANTGDGSEGKARNRLPEGKADGLYQRLLPLHKIFQIRLTIPHDLKMSKTCRRRTVQLNRW